MYSLKFVGYDNAGKRVTVQKSTAEIDDASLYLAFGSPDSYDAMMGEFHNALLAEGRQADLNKIENVLVCITNLDIAEKEVA